jgi:hypothetical protein
MNCGRLVLEIAEVGKKKKKRELEIDSTYSTNFRPLSEFEEGGKTRRHSCPL